METTVKVILTGVILWLIALVVEIARSAPSEQIWICIIGAALGIIGLVYSIRRLKREAGN
jgi:hypothetical protein